MLTRSAEVLPIRNSTQFFRFIFGCMVLIPVEAIASLVAQHRHISHPPVGARREYFALSNRENLGFAASLGP